MDINPTAGSERRRNFADQALEQFAGYGEFLKSRAGSGVVATIDSTATPSGAANIGADGLKAAKRMACLEMKTRPNEFGALGKSMAKVGAIIEGVTGIGELAQTFATERSRTDLASRLNVATLGKSIEITGRITATSVVGATVCATLAAATGLTIAPVVVGAAAGAAAGYVVGRVADAVGSRLMAPNFLGFSRRE